MNLNKWIRMGLFAAVAAFLLGPSLIATGSARMGTEDTDDKQIIYSVSGPGPIEFFVNGKSCGIATDSSQARWIAHFGSDECQLASASQKSGEMLGKSNPYSAWAILTIAIVAAVVTIVAQAFVNKTR